MPLTALAVSSAKAETKPRKLFDGGGLFLEIVPTAAGTSKTWKMAYRWQGRQTKVSFGAYPRVSLAEARRHRESAKAQIAAGVNPSAVKRQAKVAPAGDPTRTFEAVARKWLSRQKYDVKYKARVLQALERNLFPAFGAEDVAAVTRKTVLTAIQKVEDRRATDMARRLLIKCSQIYRYAVACELASADPCYAVRDALAPAPKVRHRAKLRDRDLPAFFTRLEADDSAAWSTKAALKFTILTAVRTGELRFAVRTEVEGMDGEAPRWVIPAHRMKETSADAWDEPHVVALTPPAVALLRRSFETYPDEKQLFVSDESRSGFLSENAMLYLMYRLGYKGTCTVHGFRGTFSTCANEHGFNRDHIEAQLAHIDAHSVRSAYNSAEYLSARRTLLLWWAEFLAAKGLKT
jgi:hypothetical protein